VAFSPTTGTDTYYQPQYLYAPNIPMGMPVLAPAVGSPYPYTPVAQPIATTPVGTPRVITDPTTYGTPHAPQNPHNPGGAADTRVNPPGSSTVSVNPNNPLGPNPNPVMPPPTTPGAAQPSTGQISGGQQLYDWSNPTQALVNTMRQGGMAINPLNATFQLLMRAAPGLANAFLLQGAAANDQSPDQYGNFSGFLKNALTAGNVPTVLRTAEGQLGSMIPQARAYLAADQSGSPNPLASNTLLGALAAVLGQNNGQGVLDVLSNLHTPTMNRATSSAYQNLLAGPAGLGSQANYQYGQGLLGGDTAKDFWYYLLGR
jgi:hypothetical protein